MENLINRYFNTLKYLHLQLTVFRNRYNIQDAAFNAAIFMVESDLLLILCLQHNIDVPQSFECLTQHFQPAATIDVATTDEEPGLTDEE